MTDYKVSVVIPTIGNVKNLQKSVQSVLNQKYKEFEIIIVADKYQKETLDFFDSISQQYKNISYYLCDEPVGGNEARNIGVNKAKFDWIALLDDDDIWKDNKLEKQIETIRNTENNTEKIFCSWFIGTFENSNKSIYYPRNNYHTEIDLGYYLFGLKYGRNYGAIQTSTIIANKVVFQRNTFNNKLPKHQDWDWLLSSVYNYGFSIVQVPHYLSEYIISNETSVSKKNMWSYSYEWVQNYKESINKKAYDSFLYSVVLKGIILDDKINKSQKKIYIKKYLKQISFKNKWSISMCRFLFLYLKTMN